jgi:ubiquinone/menaquinone biosynthesis C-methylase UbiE
MGFYKRTIFPFVMDKLMATAELEELRKQLLAPARGQVLEVGFGTGLNAPFFPPAVERVIAVDPNEGVRKRAARRIAAAPVPIELRTAAGERLPADDASFDCVVTFCVLCSVADLDQTLAEIFRVLKPGGRYLLFEHGLCDDPEVQKWQRRLNGLQERVCGGCQLIRPVRKSVERAGFTFETVREFFLDKGPRFGTFCTTGTAIRQ